MTSVREMARAAVGKDPKRPDELQANILSTYFTLRWGIVVLSVAFPLILYFVGRFGARIPLQPSMSAYYGAHDGYMRNWFVAILFAVGSFLYLYKGYSTLENVALNIAGVSAAFVAMVPCGCWYDDGVTHNKMHAVFAVSFFACMSFCCLFCAGDTIGLLPTERDRKRFTRLYKTIGILLLASPAGALLVSYASNQSTRKLFFIEAFGVCTVAAYWAVKSKEFRLSSAERLTAEKQVKKVPHKGVVRVEEPG